MHLASDQTSLTLAKKDHQIDQQHNQILLLEEIQAHRDEMEQQLLQGQQSRVELSE
jgi:ABC-type Fe3+/spermidine/putrescine transport system ATPase subunit